LSLLITPTRLMPALATLGTLFAAATLVALIVSLTSEDGPAQPVPHQAPVVRVVSTCAAFLRIGDVVAGKDAPPPRLSQDELAERRRRAAELASAYRSEFL
jgi:hypothetical protein